MLDNAWFINPVNTRGKSSYGASEYTIDRWRTWADISVTLAGGGLSLTSTNDGGGLFQYLDNGITAIAGKTVTFSAIIDGVLYSCTGVFTKPAWIATTVPNSGVSIVLVYPDEYPNELISASVRLDGAISTPVVVQAMKLEIGAVSTLLQDGPPNCGIELARSIYSKADPNDPYANNGFGRSNPNLLDNAYFVGGGSQLGDGVFPINQRGQTSYGASTSGAFDRWMTEGGSSVTLSSNGATFSGVTLSLYDGAAAANLVGKTVTISAQLGDGTIISGTGVVNPLSQDTMIQAWLPTGGYVGFFIFANAQSYQFCRIYSGSATLIRAVKLELGTVSTLANDPPPDFGEELRKCKRRLRYVPLKRSLVFLAGGYNKAAVTLTDAEMESFPTCSLITAGQIYDISRQTFGTPTDVTCLDFSYNIPTIQFSVPVAGDGIGLTLDTVIQLSCEL